MKGACFRMINTCIQSLRRMSLWISLPCMLILALAVTACGESAPTTTSPTPAATPASQATSTTAATSGTAATIMITEQTGGHDIYNFEPKTLSVKAGTTVKWVNNSDENHLLTCTPSDVVTAKSIVPKSGSADNTYPLTFSKAGTYTCTSKLVQRTNNQPENAASGAKVTITVTA